jgi:hypothetical protein
MQVYFLQKCGYYAGKKYKNCGHINAKMRVLCGYAKYTKERGYCNMRCKGSSTQYGRPQVARLQKFSKFTAGESVTPRGG